MSEETKEQEIAETAKPDATQATASNEQASDASLNFEQADDASEFDEEDEGVVIHDADAEDALEEARLRAAVAQETGEDSAAAGSSDETEAPHHVRGMAEMMAIIEALIFVAEEPLSVKALADVLKEDRGWIETALEGLAEEFNARGGGLHLREVAGGWQFATRPEHHEHVRAFLKTRPSAKLSLASLETLAVIAYKQPITVPEILEIRGVQSPSAIKTLLDKRLIVAKGRKETIGRPMMYGTSKEFLLQFGLKDLTELPSIEDFEDLAGGM
ncbi:MAG: SMC-Scp complex subunit ScpB [Pyrinomonadaceae bacterium]|nr:SMC-Scp complex subunit ScpB [Pyrinomonadaceae bacterium]